MGKALTPEKLKIILHKYKRPANCTVYPIKINEGAWEYLKYDKKQKELGLANMQQVLRVAFIMSQTADFIHEQASTSMTCEEFKNIYPNQWMH